MTGRDPTSCCCITLTSEPVQIANLGAQELSRFYNYFGAWFQNKRPVSQGLIKKISDEDMAANTLMAPENLRRDLTMGTAQEVIDRIRRYEDLGYDDFSFWVDSGKSAARKRASLARFLSLTNGRLAQASGPAVHRGAGGTDRGDA